MKISVISTYATDLLIDVKTKKTLREQRGGPVLYLESALESLGIKPKVFTGEELLVEILVQEHDEFGSIHQQPHPLPLPLLETGTAIVSTILNEWDLRNANNYSGKLFVDIQGYVRDGSDFGKKKSWEGIETIAPYLFCIKGNVVEIGMLPDEVVAEQKRKRMLIITKDKEGVEIYYKGERKECKPSNVIHPPNTIGAGDTFFANFVYKFMTGNTVENAGNFALDKTSEFLSRIQ